MPIQYARKEHTLRTTLTINEELLEEAKTLSGAKTKKEAIEIALEEFVRRERSKKLVALEGKVELSFSLPEFLKRRKGDVPHR
ncbi:MAG: type II toxin-antitoxin system VapB family antitoxin [Planctomycetes bacterium]|nr:type II toxin-antitoxin system VapB family antitoxin [Planctomycetota bacterium]